MWHPRTFVAMRYLLSIFAVAFLLQAAHAQDSTAYVRDKPQQKPIPFKDRLWFGGGVGLNFGSVTAIQIEPMAGVFLDRKRKLTTGLGLSYWYYQDNRYVPTLEQNAYGYRIFSRYKVIPQAYVHAEFLHMNVEGYSFLSGEERLWVPHLLLGGGYVQRLGGSGSIYLQVLWEVLQDPNSIYFGQGPIFSVGAGFGF